MFQCLKDYFLNSYTNQNKKNFSCESIKGPSIALEESESIYNFDGIQFKLTTNNLNYFDFLREELIESISYIDEEKQNIKIKINSFKISSCDERYITINLTNNRIILYIYSTIQYSPEYNVLSANSRYLREILNDSEFRFTKLN